mmetsp:Transcript_23113/g.52130  ORF Transcript_23113/g.52130 Transcript_23113/m.52130 type:complete len:206 (+) Transcript_23113:922-1539(+)
MSIPPLKTWPPSGEKQSEVTPPVWARSKSLNRFPVARRHTLIVPSIAPDATCSPSLLTARLRTGSSCIMKRSSSTTAWYGRSRRSLHVSSSHTSMNPSSEPEMREVPSGVKAAVRAWQPLPNFTCPPSRRAARSSRSCVAIERCMPLKRSYWPLAGRVPACCCHLRAPPTSASSREGGTAERCGSTRAASSCRRRSLDALPPSWP